MFVDGGLTSTREGVVLSIRERCNIAVMHLSQLGSRFEMVCFMSRPFSIRSRVIEMEYKTGIAQSALVEGLVRLVFEVTDLVLEIGIGAMVNIPYVLMIDQKAEIE